MNNSPAASHLPVEFVALKRAIADAKPLLEAVAGLSSLREGDSAEARQLVTRIEALLDGQYDPAVAEIQRALSEGEEASISLTAWQGALGSSQLSHVIARVEAAESKARKSANDASALLIERNDLAAQLEAAQTALQESYEERINLRSENEGREKLLGSTMTKLAEATTHSENLDLLQRENEALRKQVNRLGFRLQTIAEEPADDKALRYAICAPDHEVDRNIEALGYSYQPVHAPGPEASEVDMRALRHAVRQPPLIDAPRPVEAPKVSAVEQV